MIGTWLLRLALVSSRPSSGRARSCAPCSQGSPIAPGPYPQSLNGVQWPTLCLSSRADERSHFFAIGDWGGMGEKAVTFDNTRGTSITPKRHHVFPIDRNAQHAVADVLKRVATRSRPEYIVNVGDNFYPGGITTHCGQENMCTLIDTKQWHYIFEEMYSSPELDGKPWMSCLGNHDYGGFEFSKGWDQQIAYTWFSDKWILPAQYWSRRVQYCDFSVDFFFVDTQTFDAVDPRKKADTNICSQMHNHRSCEAVNGPVDPEACVRWFRALWAEQLEWLERKLDGSSADWQVVVTHFPPQWGLREWRRLAVTYGIDLFITGHRHQQEMHWKDPMLGGTTWIVTGGGGGVTSESYPQYDSDKTQQYGFFDLSFSKGEMQLDMWSWKGKRHGRYSIEPRNRFIPSCATQGCHGKFVVGQPCYCSEVCRKYGNCCSDYQAICIVASSRCKPWRCDSFVPGAPCQCNDSCHRHGNCCPDYATQCAAAASRQLYKQSSTLASPPLTVAGAVAALHNAMASGRPKTLSVAIGVATAALAAARQFESTDNLNRSDTVSDELMHLLEPAEATLILFREEEGRRPTTRPAALLAPKTGHWNMSFAEVHRVQARKQMVSCSANRRRRFQPSCASLGCEKYNSRFPCQCSTGCSRFGNCCNDYTKVCVPKLSCVTIGCGHYDASAPCQCNSKCRKYGNCCSHFERACLDVNSN